MAPKWPRVGPVQSSELYLERQFDLHLAVDGVGPLGVGVDVALAAGDGDHERGRAGLELLIEQGHEIAPGTIDATLRFQHRFEVVEDLLAERGKTPKQSNLEEMDSLWNDAKKIVAKRRPEK